MRRMVLTLVLSLIAALAFASTAAALTASGTVSVPTGWSQQNICVTSKFAGTQTVIGQTLTAPDGTYTVDISGTSNVDFDYDAIEGTCGSTPYSPWQPLQQTLANQAVSTSDLTNVNVTMGFPSNSISGSVSVPGGYATSGICVYAYASTSTGPTNWYTNTVANASGGYSIEGLPTDTYTLRVVPGQYCSDSDLLEQNGRQVAVTVGRDSSGIDFALEKPASAPVTTSAPSGAAPTTKTPSLNLAVAKPVVAGSTITTTFTASGPGIATQSGVVASGKRLARAGVTVCSVRATVKKAGKVKLACVLNAAGKRLRKKGALKVLLTTTFAPKKGTKATSTRTVTISKR